MKKIIEVLRLKYAGGLSHAQIAQACALSKGVVSKYAVAHGSDQAKPLKREQRASRNGRFFRLTRPFSAPETAREGALTRFCTEPRERKPALRSRWQSSQPGNGRWLGGTQATCTLARRPVAWRRLAGRRMSPA